MAMMTEYLLDLLTKVVDEPAIGSCIRSVCIEKPVPGGYIMTAGYPRVDRFRWELYRHAIRPFYFEDPKTRKEMDWIWQMCEDSVVIALLFYLAPQIRHLHWQVNGFSHRLLMRFLSSKIEGRLGPGAQFLSRLTNVRLLSAHKYARLPPREGAQQPHGFLTLSLVSMFLHLPSIKKVSCAHLSEIYLHGEAKPKLPLPGTSTLQKLKLDESTISVQEHDWFYKTIAAAKSLETFEFTPEESDCSDFGAVLTALARTQIKSLKKLKVWSYGSYLPLGNENLEDRPFVNSLRDFPNLRYVDTDLDFLCDLIKTRDINGWPLAMILPSGIEQLKLPPILCWSIGAGNPRPRRHYKTGVNNLPSTQHLVSSLSLDRTRWLAL